MRASTEGFTIIEVMLFLAVTGMLLLMVFIGTGSMASRQRFTDTTDSLQSYFQTELSAVENGVNTRTTSSDCPLNTTDQAGTSDRCLLLGRLLTINNTGTRVTSQYVISSVKLNGSEITPREKLKNSVVRVLTTGSTTYELKWGAAISSASRSTSPFPVGPGRGPVDSIALLQLPDTGTPVQLYYKSTNSANASLGLRAAIDTDLLAYNPVNSSINPSLVVCVKNDNDFTTTHPRAAVFFGQGEGSSAVTTNYQPEATLCP